MAHKVTSTLSMLALTVALLLSLPARADTLSLVLSNSVRGGAPGSTISFFATASAPGTNGAAVDLASDSYNLDVPLTLDDTGFFSGFPLSLAPGASFSGLLFQVFLPTTTPPGLHNGSFSILDDGGGVLSTVNFTVATTPEPGSFVLLATGVTALWTMRRRSSFR
jgi:hypothetical protein